MLSSKKRIILLILFMPLRFLFKDFVCIQNPIKIAANQLSKLTFYKYINSKINVAEKNRDGASQKDRTLTDAALDILKYIGLEVWWLVA